MSIPSAAAGLAAASGEAVAADLGGAFTIHRIAGLVAPGLIVLACAMGEGARRSGQVWEQGVYRVFLFVAVVCVVVAGFYGGLLVHGGETGWGETGGFGLTLIRLVWY